MIKDQILSDLQKTLETLGMNGVEPALEHPAEETRGDYSSNVAMIAFRSKGVRLTPEAKPKGFSKATPYEISRKIVANFPKTAYLEKVEAVAPGFINFYLKQEYLYNSMLEAIKVGEEYGKTDFLKGKKIMVEFAHPNTHKEMHIGHMRTLITGEALSRILEASGAEVFRANYQGDIGPHVAKSIFGTEIILKEKKLGWEVAEKLSLKEKAHLLGEGYVRGVSEYEANKQSFSANKDEIDSLNKKLYSKDKSVWPVYERTRKWSLDYYDELFARFYTQFNRFYFESEVFEKGKELVLANIDKIFKKSDGAIVFEGERYGLHTRVFITKDGNSTYEAKEMALAPLQFADFPFDLDIHVVANEQLGYFQVVIKALELLDSKFIGREYHLPMGMVQLLGRKMSSRTGVLITVDGLIDDVKKLLEAKNYESNLKKEEKEAMLEVVAIGAIKYSVLRTNPTLNALFDLEKSINMDGDSGPYLQYAYARTRSVLAKAKKTIDDGKWKIGVENGKSKIDKDLSSNFNLQPLSSIRLSSTVNDNLAPEELSLLRTLYKFPEVVASAGNLYSPNLLCGYLFDLAKKYNLFYNRCSILNPESRIDRGTVREMRLKLTEATGQILKNGLNLLGIKVVEKM